MDLIFNIIFTPGTVRYLRLAVLSLLEFSPYRFRLIANGLNKNEINLLNNLCQVNPRLNLYVYPSQRALTHGTMLSILEKQNDDEYFCFMDSDVFATEDFHIKLETHVKNCDVFSSGNYIWTSYENQNRGFTGESVFTPTGLPLATTFFCVYRNTPLRKIISDTGISFERYQFSEQIPESVIQMLEEMEIKRRKFDTGKLINIIGNYYNHRFKYIPLEGLNHIGGVSLMLPQQNSYYPGKELFYNILTMFNHQSNEALKKGIRKDNRKKSFRNRRRIGKFFAEYIKYLFDDTKKPLWTPLDTKINKRVLMLCNVLEDIYEKHKASL